MRSVNFPKPMVAFAAAGLLLTGCGGTNPNPAEPAAPGAEGTWELVSASEITPDSKSIEIGVIRLGCAGGVTGEVAKPVVGYEQDRIIIRADVVPHSDLDAVYTCPGNDSVSVTINLDEAIGDRELIDAACLAGEATGTSFCADGAARWKP